MLREKGFGGFPSLAFMDAEGNVLGSPGARSVELFEACLDALQRAEPVRAKAAAGDAVAIVELLFIEHALGKVDSETFAARAAALTEVTAPQRAQLDQILVDNRIWDLVAERDEAVRARGLLELLEAGKRPSKAPKYATNFWSMLARWGEKTGDAALLRKCVAGMRADLADTESMLRYADSMEQKAEGLDRRDALVERQQAGETGLEAQILLLEVELKAIDTAGIRARLDPALAVATAEQRELLLQAAVDVEVYELWYAAATGQAGAENAGARLLELFYAGERRPTENLKRNALGHAASWAGRNLDRLDADTLEALAADLRQAGRGNQQELAGKLEARAAELRKD